MKQVRACSRKWMPGSIAAALAGCACLGMLRTAQADLIVKEGWDLFRTVAPGALFEGQLYQGVGFGAYDFGAPIGSQSVGITDTIVHRQRDAEVDGVPSLPETAEIPIEMVALQLRSVNPYDPDGAGSAPNAFYFVTLQSRRSPTEQAVLGQGLPSLGLMQITFDNDAGGSFTSQLIVNFDIRVGALDGPIVRTELTTLNQSNPAAWGRVAPPGALTIDDVNYQLKSDDTIAQDFWLAPSVILHNGPHPVVSSPEPHEFALLAGLGLFGFAAVRRVAVRRHSP